MHIGRSMSLNLHGHSMTSDGNDILIFGGKEAVDSRELEAKRLSKERTILQNTSKN